MKADQAYPPVVGLAVMRARHGLDNEEAERRFMAEQGMFGSERKSEVRGRKSGRPLTSEL